MHKILIAWASIVLSAHHLPLMAQDSERGAGERTKSHHHQISIELPLAPSNPGSSEVTRLDEDRKAARVRKIESSEELLKVFDTNGKPLPMTKIEGPLNANKIVSVKTITIMDIEGSHYLAIVVDGVAYQIPLPD